MTTSTSAAVSGRTGRTGRTDKPDLAPLRRALLADTAASAGLGLLLATAAPVLSGALGIPRPWLLGLGLFILVYGIDIALVANRLPRWLPVARLVPAGNALWVTASVGTVLFGAFDLTALGTAVVLGQAAVVAGLAVAQQRALAGRPA